MLCGKTVFLVMRAHDAGLGLAAARRVEDITRTVGEPPNIGGYAAVTFGYAHLMAERALDATASARVAFEYLQRSDRPWSESATALLAEALLAAGELSAAEAAAGEAITWCRRTRGGNYEAIAHGVMARALLRRDGIAVRAAIETALDNAASLIDRTGARTFAPALLEWRAELAAVPVTMSPAVNCSARPSRATKQAGRLNMHSD